MASTIKTEEDLAELFEILDERSRAMLWHLWWHRHARICELRSVINADSDFEVLSRLKEVINGKAWKLWGKPVVSFEESKTDSLTGEKVLFSWWLLDGEDVLVTGRDRLLVDVFEEKDSVTIIAQLPAWERTAHTGRGHQSDILEVKVNHVEYKNGFLQISMEKGRK
jgi:hypothetical protein